MNRRSFIAATAGVGTVLLAGCSDDWTGSGDFQLLSNDQPTAIDDFDSLDVTLSSASVFRADEDEVLTSAVVNETVTEIEDSEGFVEFDLDSETVDLTKGKGDRAVSVLEGELEEGRYSGIERRVASAEGVVDGEDVDVTVPPDRRSICFSNVPSTAFVTSWSR